MTVSRASTPCSSRLTRAEAVAQVRAQLVEGVELARQLGEVVVEGGELALADGLDGDGDVGVVGIRAVRRARCSNVALSPALEADDDLVEAVEQVAAADLVRQAGRRRVLDGLAVAVAARSMVRKSPVLRGALDRGERREPRAQRLDLLVDVGVGDLGVGDLDLETLVVGQRRSRDGRRPRR